jgi:hypothetical protein
LHYRVFQGLHLKTVNWQQPTFKKKAEKKIQKEKSQFYFIAL